MKVESLFVRSYVNVIYSNIPSMLLSYKLVLLLPNLLNMISLENFLIYSSHLPLRVPLRVVLKGPLSGLRQFVTIENPTKTLKNASYFLLKALFVLEMFTFLSCLFGHVEKWLGRKAMVNFKIYEVTDWTTNNYNRYITQYLKK